MGIENIFKTRKESIKSHVDSCYYAISLERSFHSEAATGGVLQNRRYFTLCHIPFTIKKSFSAPSLIFPVNSV